MLKRQIFAKIWEKIDNQDILLLNGARQTGKTTLLKMIKEKLEKERGIKPEQILWYDLENINDLNIWSDQTTALNHLPAEKNKRFFIFIDEFQKAKNIGSTLKVIHDHNPQLKFIITGSASWYLNIDESMAGRKQVINIWPLTFAEYLDWQNNPELNKNFSFAVEHPETAPVAIQIINDFLTKFIIFGGYPKVVLAENDQDKSADLDELLNSYLLRDLQLTNYTIDKLQAKKILTLLADQAGNLLDLQNIGMNIGVSRTIISNRLHLLQNTFILHFLPPYFTNKSKELVKRPKVLIVDNGIYGALMRDFSALPQTKQFGQLAENFVAIELLKQMPPTATLFYWRSKQNQEVDFVLKEAQGLTPIEVKSGTLDIIPPGMQSFIRVYKPREAFVLNWTRVQDKDYKGCLVHFRPLWWAGRI